MALRLGDLVNDWQYADADAEIRFDGTNVRIVKMDVRAEVRSSLFADFGDGPLFLCVVDNIETIEFIATGPFTLHGEAPIYVRSADSTYVHADNTDEVIFTKMHDRRPVAPEILELQKLVHKNMERMRAQMARDVAGMRRSTERELKRREDALAESERAAAAARAESPDQRGSSAEEDGGGKPPVEPPKERAHKK